MEKRALFKMLAAIVVVALCLTAIGCSGPEKSGRDLMLEYQDRPEVAAYLGSKDLLDSATEAALAGKTEDVIAAQKTMEEYAQGLIKLKDVPKELETAHSYLTQAAMAHSEAMLNMAKMAKDIEAGGTGSAGAASSKVALELAAEYIGKYSDEMERVVAE